ncbi:MAG: protein-glutamate O-methyltransferase CheR [Nitrospinae bacterium]|nr:protein-glutamate O-methyltransferase CheR [Nitrospinota bacterium]
MTARDFPMRDGCGSIEKPDSAEVEDLEIRLLLEGVFQRYGYDFRDYALSSLKRRTRNFSAQEGVSTISALQEKILRDPELMERYLHALSVNVTSMFRDPGFYRAFREKVAPFLRTYPSTRIWHAGCSSGEEVYSMAILLMEEGLHEKTRIYATDFDEKTLQQAKTGVYPLQAMADHEKNYIESGGKRSLPDYYVARYDHVMFAERLRENIVWAQHNLVTDGSFNEFHAIVCRNVMIYFNSALQARVHKLFHESLARFGILALGEKETIHGSPVAACYGTVDEYEKIYKRKQ